MIAVGVARPERVGAGDDHDGDREQQRGRWTSAPTTQTRRRRSAAPPISATSTSQNAARSASRCPGALEFCASCTSCDDLRQRGVRADLGGADPQRAVGVDRRADDLVARRLVHRQALAGDHRLVDLGLAVLDDAVDRDLRRRGGPAAGRRPRPRRWAPRPAAPSRSTTALGGARSSRARMASLAPPRARISNQCPSSTNAVEHRGGLVEDLAAAGQRDHQASTASRRRPRRRPAPSCPASGPAAPARRRRRRSSAE